MAKKLPGVFVNTIDKELHNNEHVYVSSQEREVSVEQKDVKEEHSINQPSVSSKINQIFSSRNYIYKADVSITLQDETITKKIIGKNGNYLITYENELIPIDEITDIQVIEKST